MLKSNILASVCFKNQYQLPSQKWQNFSRVKLIENGIIWLDSPVTICHVALFLDIRFSWGKIEKVSKGKKGE